jgi:hypothetical protein
VSWHLLAAALPLVPHACLPKSRRTWFPLPANRFFFGRLSKGSKRFHHIPPIRWNQCIVDIMGIFSFEKPFGFISALQPNIGIGSRLGMVPHFTWFQNLTHSYIQSTCGMKLTAPWSLYYSDIRQWVLESNILSCSLIWYSKVQENSHTKFNIHLNLVEILIINNRPTNHPSTNREDKSTDI